MSTARHTRNIVRLMIISDDHILLAKHGEEGRVIYFLPGGGIEYNESLFDAAKRELSEEIGVSKDRVTSIRPVGVYEHTWSDKGEPIHEISIVCHCNVTGLNKAQDVASQESHLTFVWQKLDQLNVINLLPADFKILLPDWSRKPQASEAFFASGMQRSEP